MVHRGGGDEAHVHGGEFPLAGVAHQDDGGADGLGHGMAPVAAAGVVARGNHGGLAEQPGLDLVHGERLVGEVSVSVPGQPALSGKDEPKRADGGEVLGQQGLEFGGVPGALGAGPFAEEPFDWLSHLSLLTLRGHSSLRDCHELHFSQAE